MPKTTRPQLRFIVRYDTLYLRCSFNGQTSEKNTGITSVGFDKKKQMFKGNRPLNLLLDELLTKCEEQIEDGQTNPKLIINPNTVGKHTFTKLIDDYVRNNDLTYNTKNTWKALKNHLVACFGDDKRCFKFREFLDYMTKLKLSESSISLYLTRCKTLGFEVEQRIMKRYTVQQREYYLSEEQMFYCRKHLQNVITSGGKVYDGELFFNILLYTALSPIDLAMLRRKQINLTSKERNRYIVITGKRRKTFVKFKIVLPFNGGFIESFFKTAFITNDGGKYLLPIFEDIDGDEKKMAHRLSNYLRTRTNKVRKIIETEVNPMIEKENERKRNKVSPIDTKKMTFYSARHSVIMSMLNKNIPPAQLSMFLGRSISGIQNYFHTLEDNQMFDLAEQI